VESILKAKAKADVVVDNGAASFLPFSRYLVENDIPAVLREHATPMMMHTVVTGDDAHRRHRRRQWHGHAEGP
jgi:hypothetical protein